MKCLPGFDGGMNQTFHILVRDRQTNNVKYDNASLTKPELIIGKPKYLLEKFKCFTDFIYVFLIVKYANINHKIF